jgi:hypothetical protein
MPVLKIAAAAILTVLAGAPREFGIGGGAVLCVPEHDIDLDVLPYTPDPKRLPVGGGRMPGFPFQFSAGEVRRHVPAFVVDPHVADLRQANTLAGSLGFLDAGDRRHDPVAPALTCRDETLRYGRHSGTTLHTCERMTRIDGFLIRYEIQQANAPLTAALDGFLRAKIAAWRAACHATDRM